MKPPKGSNQNYFWMSIKISNSMAFHSNRTAYIILILFNLIMAGQTFFSLTYIEYNMNAAYKLLKGEMDYRAACIGVFGFIIVLVSFRLMAMVTKWWANKLHYSLAYYFEYSLNDKLSRLKWEYYETHAVNVQINEVKNRSLSSISKIVDDTIFIISMVPMCAIYIYFLLQINFIAVIAYFIVMPICNCLSSRVRDIIKNIWDSVQPDIQKKNYIASLFKDKDSHQEYEQKRLYHYFSAKWEEFYTKEYNATKRIYKKLGAINKISSLILYIPRFAMNVYVGYEVVIGVHLIGFFTMVNSLLTNITASISNIQSILNTDVIESMFVKAYNDLLAFEEDEDKKKTGVSEDIQFRNVSYKYPQSSNMALDCLSMHIVSNEKIAIVGVNGSGKTTFTNMLLSLISPSKGQVSGCEQQIVSCIVQDFAQYQMTVKENIIMGCPNRNFSDEEILTILDKVGLKQEILKLEYGIHTHLGQLEQGVELSKGQWQRLAVCRLLANPEATIWILDEPTAYLDPIVENDLYDMIYQLAVNKTVLFISHRLGFARRADRIFVFDNGKMIEEGSHDRLMENNQYYAAMYRAQESWYVT